MKSKIVAYLPGELSFNTHELHGYYMHKGKYFLMKYFYKFSDVPSSLSPWIIVILSLCFVNCHDGDFVFDDTEAIVNNNDVRDTPIWDLFHNDFWGTKLSHSQSHKSYRPFTILSFR